MIGPIFKAYDVRATYPDPLNETAAWKVGYASGQFLQRQSGHAKGGNVVVSRDMRPHSESLAQQLALGLRAAGVNVIDLGMCDTSIIYFAVNHLDAIGGIQTTASHNPINYNGFKISGLKAKPIGADTGLKEIEKTANDLSDTNVLEPIGSYQQRNIWDEYRKHILSFMAPLKKPIKLYIDASNGMAGKLVPKVFDGVENLQIIPLNFEITGSFVHEPNPLKAENMEPTQAGVKEHGADLGACFDGDADRCMVTDDQGRIVGCDHLTALLAHHFADQERTRPQAGRPCVVYDLRSSKVVAEELEQLGAAGKRSRVGHVFMKAMLRENESVFGGELSGHFYFRDNYYADSGAIALAAILSVLSASDQTMSQLIDPLRRYPQSGELNFRVEDKDAVKAQLQQTYQDADEIDELDGVTIDCFKSKGWWFNVRASNTEPLLRLNAEAKDQATLEALLKEVEPLLGEPDEGH